MVITLATVKARYQPLRPLAMMAMSSGAKRIATEREAPGFRLARDLSDTLRRSLEWSHDVDEGIAAHRDDRKPKFLGR